MGTISVTEKQKFDISKIDEQLEKNKKNKKAKQNKQVNDSTIFMTDLTMSQSYA